MAAPRVTEQLSGSNFSSSSQMRVQSSLPVHCAHMYPLLACSAEKKTVVSCVFFAMPSPGTCTHCQLCVPPAGDRRDWVRQDDSDDAIFGGGRLHGEGQDRLHAAAACCRDERREARVRRVRLPARRGGEMLGGGAMRSRETRPRLGACLNFEFKQGIQSRTTFAIELVCCGWAGGSVSSKRRRGTLRRKGCIRAGFNSNALGLARGRLLCQGAPVHVAVWALVTAVTGKQTVWYSRAV